jgi:hypothetical protein
VLDFPLFSTFRDNLYVLDGPGKIGGDGAFLR